PRAFACCKGKPSPRITVPPADRRPSPLIALTRKTGTSPLSREYACHLHVSASLGECAERKVATSQRPGEWRHFRSHPVASGQAATLDLNAESAGSSSPDPAAHRERNPIPRTSPERLAGRAGGMDSR